MKKQITIVMLTCVVFSCKKNNPAGEVTQGDMVLHQIDLNTINPSNSSNPFDSAGVWHNAGLKHVQKKTKWWDTGLVKIDQYAIEYVRTRLNKPVPPTMVPLIRIALSDSSNKYRYLINQIPHTDAVKAYLTSLLEITESKLAGPIETNDDFLDFIDMVCNLESMVAGDRRLDDLGRQAILQASSVARHSAYYWLTDAVEGSIDRPSIQFKLIKFLAKVTGDIAGAIGGFIHDATTGSIVAGAIESSAWWAWHIEHTTPFGG